MARTFSVSFTSYARWESGIEPNFETLIDLANFFRVSVQDLLLKDMKKEGIPEVDQTPTGMVREERAKYLTALGEKDMALQDLRRDQEKIAAALKSLLADIQAGKEKKYLELQVQDILSLLNL